MLQVATVCGWGSTEKGKKNELVLAEFLDNLHCSTVTLFGEKYCRVRIPQGDYQRKFVCGMSEDSAQITTMVNAP